MKRENVRRIFRYGDNTRAVSIPKDLGFEIDDSVIFEKVDDISCKFTKIDVKMQELQNCKNKKIIESVNHEQFYDVEKIMSIWSDELKSEFIKNNIEFEKIEINRSRIKFTMLIDRIIYKIFTAYNRYDIVVDISIDIDSNIDCMCNSSTRRPLKGENHNRMSDMTDGKFNLDTLKLIKQDIVENEINHREWMKINNIEYENFELEPFEFINCKKCKLKNQY